MADRPADLITLPHQVEFMSDRWLEEAQRFFRDALPARKAQLGGRTFSVSERFTDAPPHLRLPDDVASWTLRFNGEEAAIERGFAPNASMTIEADYQAALYLAQFVGVLLPDGAEEMWREARHLFGKDAFRVRGSLTDPQAARLMGLFHDHMARRTVENPDLEHRARRLGLIGKIREMDEQGYTVIERAISDDFADEVRAATKQAVLPEQGVSMFWMLYQGRPFERLALNPLAMTLIDASLGRGAQLASMAAIIRGPGPGQIENHTDYIDVPEPYPEFAMTGVAVWAFEDWTEASGPTWIVPKSHRMRRAPRASDGLTGGVPIEMPKGSLVYFTQGVWHWQGHRSEPGERVTLHPHFNRGILRGLEPYKTDVQLLGRNPPRLGEMLGQDDGFQKMISTGRDYLRIEHMRQLHAFTRRKMKAILGEPAAVAA
ncbi:MAG TPA: phytanoyl-CoA dioxygenase family protein [Caulobacteraceae bacterium]|jgi:ectoine hydroxylase-related dioxygenase (phytanoyl-CoA dioxygenase family)